MHPTKMTRTVLASWFLATAPQIWAQAPTSRAPAAETSFVLASTKIHVPVQVGDVETWFILDTGANVSILDRSLAEELGLELRDLSKQAGGAGAGGFSVAFTTLPHLAWAGLERRDVPIAVIDRQTAAANGHESRGLLGANVFREYVVEIDYEKRRLTLHAPEGYLYTGSGTSLPITLDAASKCHLEALIVADDGESIRADMIVDTGSRGFADFTAPFSSQHDLVARVGTTYQATVGWGVGGEVRHWVGRLKNLRTGPFEFHDPVVTLAPPGTGGAFGRDDRSGILGAEWLARFRVIFDYSRERLILEAAEDFSRASEWDASGLFLRSEPPDFREIRIVSVAEGSPAANADLQAGDIIHRIDDRAVVELGLDGLRRELREAGRTVTMEVVRDGDALSVQVALRDLF